MRREFSLSELLTLQRRPVQVEPEQEYAEIGVRSFGKGIFHKLPRLGLEVGDKELHLVKEGDFILQITFAWEGAIGLASGAEDGMYCSVRFPTFRVNKELCEPKYLLYYFKTPAGLRQLGNISPGSAGRNRVLSVKRVPEIIVSLPPLDEQRRIVAHIEALAARIAEARGLRHQVQEEQQTMLLGIHNQLTTHAKRMPMSVIAPLVRRPVDVKHDQIYRELGIRSFGNGTFHKSPITGLELGSKRVFQIEPGDLLFSNVFAWEGAIAVAKPEDQGRIGSHRFISCVPKEGIATARFLCFHFLTPKGLSDIGQASPGGAGRNRTLGLEKLERIIVPVPDYEKQIEFDNLHARIDALKRLQAETAAELDALLPAVLDRAFHLTP